jgi:hypothetical protein
MTTPNIEKDLRLNPEIRIRLRVNVDSSLDRYIIESIFDEIYAGPTPRGLPLHDCSGVRSENWLRPLCASDVSVSSRDDRVTVNLET